MSANCDVLRQHTGGDLIWYQEDFRRYVQGGYHPVTLKDTLADGRYTIWHKLGWGGFSMVWLARDSRADASGSANEHELLSRLSPSDSSFIVRLRDHFTHQGPNGQHLCLVFDLLGPSLHQLIEVCREAAEIEEVGYHEFLKPRVILKASKQLLSAIAYLHEAGYVHGDITPKNMAFTTYQLSRLGEDDFFKIIGKARTEIVSRRDGEPLHRGIPAQLTDSITWSEWSDELVEDIRLFDFGCSFPHSNLTPEKIHQPSQFQAPETLLLKEFDFRSDLWSVGVVLYSLMFSFTSFYWGGDIATALSQMADLVGGFPTEWQQHYDQLEDSRAFETHASPKLDVELRHVRSKTLKPLFPVLRGLLKMTPSERITAREALELMEPVKPRRAANVQPRREGLRKRKPETSST